MRPANLRSNMSMPFTTLYTPLAGEYCLSEFGFFIIGDEWDEESLVDLKYKAGIYFLFGLQTTEKSIEELDVIDGVIICQPNEVQQVILIYESIILSSRTRLGLDLNDLKIPFWYTKPAKFIQISAIAPSESDRLERASNHIMSQISEGLSVDYIILSFESDRNLSIAEYSELSTVVESSFTDDAEVFYNLRYVDRADFCWMGIIYAA